MNIDKQLKKLISKYNDTEIPTKAISDWNKIEEITEDFYETFLGDIIFQESWDYWLNTLVVKKLGIELAEKEYGKNFDDELAFKIMDQIYDLIETKYDEEIRGIWNDVAIAAIIDWQTNYFYNFSLQFTNVEEMEAHAKTMEPAKIMFLGRLGDVVDIVKEYKGRFTTKESYQLLQWLIKGNNNSNWKNEIL